MIRTFQPYIFVALLFVAAGIAAALPTQDQEIPSHAERSKAINIVRMINTAEVVYSSRKAQSDGHGQFVSWDELYASGVLKPIQPRWNVELSAGPEVIPGYHLDLLVSPDGQSFSVALHDKKEGDRLFSVFSDQTGIIYLGAPMQ